jgi:hypothetical protein
MQEVFTPLGNRGSPPEYYVFGMFPGGDSLILVDCIDHSPPGSDNSR